HKRSNSKKAKDIKSDKYIPTNRQMTNQETYISMKKALVVMGNLLEEEFEDRKQKISHYLQLSKHKDEEEEEESVTRIPTVHSHKCISFNLIQKRNNNGECISINLIQKRANNGRLCIPTRRE
ncbi:hypothetical protein H5410_061742, partial [Solanum commersonii]